MPLHVHTEDLIKLSCEHISLRLYNHVEKRTFTLFEFFFNNIESISFYNTAVEYSEVIE